MSLTIRHAKQGDANLVLTFIRELADYEKLLHEVETTEADIDRDMFCLTPRVFCEIAEWDGHPAGFALWYYTYSTFRGSHGIWLEDLYVAPDFRGKRIGKHLMAELARRCINEKLTRFEWCVLDWNKPSIEFYQSICASLQEGWTDCRLDGDALKRLSQTV